MEIAMVAAGFTAGEADQLRRAMAAWKKKGGLGPFQQKLKQGLRARGYTQEFADRLFRQIEGFGDYGFPESHSASFALLAYASAWLKLHQPAAFLCALLNSQPMGFYSPAQLVQDAGRACGARPAVQVLPVDVLHSAQECTLEAVASPPGAAADADQPAVRLGLCMVGGLAQAAMQRLVQARHARAFTGLEDLALRAQLERRDLDALARAGALAALAGHRHLAQWQVAGLERRSPLALGAAVHEAAPALRAPAEGEEIVADYASLGLTLGRHPLALLRPHLARLRSQTARELLALPHGRAARMSGIVTGRQRPGTASGTVFVTLEDETGWVNVIVWPALVEAQRKALLGARLMTVHGRLEREGTVTHLIAQRLLDHSALLGRLATASRDFH